ncbi:hypothetical protein L7F22_004859 [Adiantum nelumboides]|nr:hypothetical protein [Adiantum nelumboides]
MQQHHISLAKETYVLFFQACVVVGTLDKGKQIHDDISRQGLLQHNVGLSNTLLSLYTKCGALGQLQIVLEELPSCNVACWSALMAGYAQDGQASCPQRREGACIFRLQVSRGSSFDSRLQGPSPNLLSCQLQQQHRNDLCPAACFAGSQTVSGGKIVCFSAFLYS